ncbi:protein-glutamate O-methyltransferase CheR [Brevibacillus composti]|uniref:Protein-glutamate O-methyltransferase CheR n=1 Tax=Brevibacillus composti TaxID=2796470 RepID=A0A7T5EPQ4_9BACL|nr:protein-glutamate O-methyltransferase CheR [Brevibacillus composti]QQE76480.1 protein-glutamate O-methyltransferase CheR [Brevibacillus composti]QUO43555.1 protein-glutamate O-methyltransferase CheR [Brevibacillus composti]
MEIALLLEGIYRQYGYDFRNYNYAAIRRRIWHRIRTEKVHTISALQEKVLHDPMMMDKLFGDFSINVTEMFRDPSFFRVFREKIVPELRDLPFIRIWHAGCSTGQEVFSMAILLHEEGLLSKTRLYATDMNEKVLKNAIKGSFPLQKMQQYTKNYLRAGGKRASSEYYQVKNGIVQFKPFLKENTVFAQHNLVTDRSFNEFHIIICRNVMIYFNQILQNHVHELFYESLCTNGFLGLGDKEGVVFTTHANCYEEVDRNEKLFRKLQ